MMRVIIFIWLFLSLNLRIIYSQQPEFIRGKVIDSKTSLPVPYATLHLKDSRVGIYTNAEGDFRILNNPAFQSDSLIVTCIGFHRLSMPFSILKKPEAGINIQKTAEMNVLKLVPNIYVLKEVSVDAKKRKFISPDMIIARALGNLRKNSSLEPFSYVSYYRDYQKDSVNYLNLNEAIVQTLDRGFACTSDSNKYRLIAFKKNMDFSRVFVNPNYDLPETDHSDLWFKRVPHAIVGDQYGNELFILLVHDAIRNYNKRSFSFIETLTQDFIRAHRFSSPDGIYDGNTRLYKFSFAARKQVTGDTIDAKGAIFIQPEDYSIHRLEYSASFLNSGNKNQEIFSIEIEYGHEPAVNSKMCLKYISFNNTFTIPDSTDNDFFKVLKSEWRQLGGPYDVHSPTDMTIVTYFNRKIDPVSGSRASNYDLTIGEKKAKITGIQINGDTSVFLTVRDDRFKSRELASCQISIKNVKDVNGHLLDKRRDLKFRQFRELFVQEYNKSLDFQDTCFIQSRPLEQNSISISDNSGSYWMNTPLKDEEKQKSLE